MRITYRRAGFGLGFLLLGACGGGNINSSGPSLAPDHSVSIVFNPANLSVTSVEGLRRHVMLHVQVSGSPQDNSGYLLKILDPDGMIQPDTAFLDGNAGYLIFDMHTNSKLKTGVTKGTITIQACSHDCKRIDGAGKLSLQVTVSPDTDLSALQPLSGVPDWQTGRGGNGQQNYVPVTLDAAKFKPRWIVSTLDLATYPSVGISVGAPVTDSANHILIGRTFQTGIIALSEVDGSELWHVTPGTTQFGPPALYNGIVYAVSVHEFEPHNTILRAYNDLDGTQLFAVPMADCGCEQVRSAPVVANGIVFVVGSQLQAYDAATGAHLWDGPVTSQVAADASNVYFYEPNATSPGVAGAPGFTALDQATGTVLWQIARDADPADVRSSSLNGDIPALDGAGGAVVSIGGGRLDGGFVERYSLSGHTRLWAAGFNPQLYSNTTSPIAVANGAAYVPTLDGDVASIDLATGQERWRAAAAGWYMLVTKNLLFVTDNDETYALDLKTRKVVWSVPVGGQGLSLSPSGILYISAPLGTFNRAGAGIVAINLH